MIGRACSPSPAGWPCSLYPLWRFIVVQAAVAAPVTPSRQLLSAAGCSGPNRPTSRGWRRRDGYQNEKKEGVATIGGGNRVPKGHGCRELSASSSSGLQRRGCPSRRVMSRGVPATAGISWLGDGGRATGGDPVGCVGGCACPAGVARCAHPSRMGWGSWAGVGCPATSAPPRWAFLCLGDFGGGGSGVFPGYSHSPPPRRRLVVLPCPLPL